MDAEKTRSYQNYSEDNLQRAIKKVRNKQLSATKANAM